MADGEAHAEILRYWLGSSIPEPRELRQRMHMWFRADPELDGQIAARFGPLIEQAFVGRLALIILLDQFRRNVYRGTKEAFAGDGAALALARDGLDCGMDAALSVTERAFFYMPLQHAEALAAQEVSVATFRRLVDDSPPALRPAMAEFLASAQQHYAIIERFARFPHRNAVLQRECTRAELAYLLSERIPFRK